MARWTYCLKSGKALRQAIGRKKPCEVVKMLLSCYGEIMENVDNNNPWILDQIEDVEIWVEDPDVDGEIVDELLYDFYNVCDDLRIWVEL